MAADTRLRDSVSDRWTSICKMKCLASIIFTFRDNGRMRLSAVTDCERIR